jgi:hypothetical protein
MLGHGEKMFTTTPLFGLLWKLNWKNEERKATPITLTPLLVPSSFLIKLFKTNN